ncbi:MAG: host-nuclease inhibitor Gam family protein [Candidatus Dehalobacter alkaniphilus]
MSDKTVAALAAELNPEAKAPETTEQQPAPVEELAPITLEELEDLALPGDAPEAPERPPFRIADDGCADWAVRKILEEKREYDRIRGLGEQQIAALQEKIDRAKRRFEQNTGFLTGHLSSYFLTVPHKATKTTEKYRLLSGTLTLKLGQPKPVPDDEKLVTWLKANGYNDMIKTEEKPTWGEFKKKLTFTGTMATVAETGEIVDGITVIEQPDIFTVDL